jgi:eukaryotic-like serine/threonine-protein kinase
VPPDRWEEINRIYDAALELEDADRPGFVREACQGDEDLRREVESLLAYEKPAQHFIDRPALQLTAEKLAAEPPSLVGRQLGPYQIQGVLGAGGMGEVYKARDTRLNRTVAIKVLPRHLSERADLRQRFEREARAIASLDHPHICTLYDIGHEGTTGFLVMQYLDGETLSQLLRRGPLPTEEVLRYSIEIAGALDTAHRKGVIHRDLKPGNIMLTHVGAKLLDFGLAKRQTPVLRTGATSVEGALRATSGLATESESLTEEGMILGTLEYMAPEQLEGKEADARTDIFALGVVIYEMATGQKAFKADSKASLIARILTFQPPPIATIQPVSPTELDVVVQKCLPKNPEVRWQSAADVTSELQEIARTVLPLLKARKGEKEPSVGAKEIMSIAGPAVPAAIPESRNVASRLIRSRAWQLGFVGVLLAVILGSLVVWRGRQRPETQPREVSFKPLTSFSSENPVENAAISPDGKYLAFCSEGKLSRQVVSSGEKRSVPLPEGFRVSTVTWFPDGTKLLLGRQPGSPQSDGSVWALSLLGGPPQMIVEQASFPSVSPDGSLVAFIRSNAERNAVEIWVVGANGEGPRRVRAPSFGEGPPTDPPGYYAPVWSSDGQRLFYLRDDQKSRFIESSDLNGDKVTTPFSSKAVGFHSLCWAPDGRILFFMHNERQHGIPETAGLWEIRVDIATGKPLSAARRLTQWSGYGFVNARTLSITADGQRLALLRGGAQTDVYVAELGPGGKAMKTPRRLTQVDSDDAAWDWMADSRAVLFASTRNGRGDFDIFKQDTSQPDAEPIVATADSEWHPNLSPDGAFILYLIAEQRSPTASRLLRVPVSGGPPELVLRGEKIKNFSCAREAKQCVVVEEVAGRQILTTFDPLKGRGEKLPMSDYPQFARGILSPQGRLIDKMKSSPEGLRIGVRSLTGESVEEFTFKNLTGDYQFYGWSADGKGIYIGMGWGSSSDFLPVLYAGLSGHSQVLWKRQSGPGAWFDYPIPSPDGRYLAVTIGTYESNAWMLENF